MPVNEGNVVRLVILYEQRLTKLRAALVELEEWQVLAEDDRLARLMNEKTQ